MNHSALLKYNLKVPINKRISHQNVLAKEYRAKLMNLFFTVHREIEPKLEEMRKRDDLMLAIANKNSIYRGQEKESRDYGRNSTQTYQIGYITGDIENNPFQSLFASSMNKAERDTRELSKAA